MIINRTLTEIAMANANMRVSTLCQKANIQRSTLHKAMQGKSILPVTAGRIARALGVKVQDIIEQEVTP